jgi:hypothetical protein
MGRMLDVIHNPGREAAWHKGVTGPGVIKLGNLPRTYAGAQTCWDGCPYKRNGCYAEEFTVALTWSRVTERSTGMPLEELCTWIAKLPYLPWRYGVAGDLPGIDARIDPDGLRALVAANDGRPGWAYTHKPLDRHRNAELIAMANDNGFTVNVSANGPGLVDQPMSHGLPTVCVVPRMVGDWRTLRTAGGRKIVRCPAEYGVTDCSRCGAGTPLCARADRDYAIGFTAHGSRAHKADAVCTGESNG